MKPYVQIFFMMWLLMVIMWFGGLTDGAGLVLNHRGEIMSLVLSCMGGIAKAGFSSIVLAFLCAVLTEKT